jgi:hypothetical protein
VLHHNTCIRDPLATVEFDEGLQRITGSQHTTRIPSERSIEGSRLSNGISQDVQHECASYCRPWISMSTRRILTTHRENTKLLHTRPSHSRATHPTPPRTPTIGLRLTMFALSRQICANGACTSHRMLPGHGCGISSASRSTWSARIPCCCP